MNRYPGDSGQRYDLRIDGAFITSWSDLGQGDDSGAQVVDLSEHWVLPAFVDSHLHLLYSMEHFDQLDLMGLPVDAIATVIADSCSSLTVGHGWKDPVPEQMKPDPRRFLDNLISDDPVLLWNADLHRALVNSAALELASVSPAGHSGIVVEEAAEQIWNSLPRDQGSYARKAARWLLEHGIAAATTFDRGASIETLREKNKNGELGIRIRHGLPEDLFLSGLDSGTAVLPEGSREDPFAMPWIKIFVDGTLGSRTAWMKSDYSDDPGNHGVIRRDVGELERTALAAGRAGWALALHAIGDAAVVAASEAISVTRAVREIDLPDRIEHFQLVDPQDLGKIRDSGAIASLQPCHLYQDREILEQRWGSRASHAFALRSIDSAGIPIALGTDAPVEELDPWCDIDSAVQRRGRGRTGPRQAPEQCVPFSSAFRWRTSDAAHANFLPVGWGTLEPGSPADLQILGASHPEQVSCQQEAKLLDVYSLGSWRLGRIGVFDES